VPDGNFLRGWPCQISLQFHTLLDNLASNPKSFVRESVDTRRGKNLMATSKTNKSNGSGLDFEAQLWAAADKMRGHMDASEYKHGCLGQSDGHQTHLPLVQVSAAKALIGALNFRATRFS
jgi:hypothetical protein